MESVRLLKVLRFGARFWNIWRDEHSDAPVLLDGVKLDGANLRQADFRGARLTTASYSSKDLEGALNLPAEVQ